MNLKRRHLTSSQKAAIAIDILPLLEEEARKRQGTRTDITQKFAESEYGEARKQVAQILNTNRQYISDTKALKQNAPELLEEVKNGEISISEAKRMQMARAGQENLITSGGKFLLLGLAPTI
jgi:predicted flavoprotein YhiN